MPTLEKIYPENIRLDGGTQPRAEIDKVVCKEYEEQMKAGEKFPPVDVFYDGEDYWLADGFHRIEAYVMALPGDAIECNVFLGSLQDAQWYSYSVNRTHGVRRTNPDKVRAVKAALAHPAAKGKSNVEIAEHCGVDEKTVRKYRPKDLTSEIPKSRLRKGRDGRTINTAGIGKHPASKKRQSPPTSWGHISPDVVIPTLGHSLQPPITTRNLSPTNPVMAAATIFRLFDANFVRTLIVELTKRLKGIER